MGVETAIIGGAALMAGSSIIGSSQQAKGMSKAASAQDRGAMLAAESQRQGLQANMDLFYQGMRYQEPYRYAGAQALESLQRELYGADFVPGWKYEDVNNRVPYPWEVPEEQAAPAGGGTTGGTTGGTGEGGVQPLSPWLEGRKGGFMGPFGPIGAQQDQQAASGIEVPGSEDKLARPLPVNTTPVGGLNAAYAGVPGITNLVSGLVPRPEAGIPENAAPPTGVVAPVPGAAGEIPPSVATGTGEIKTWRDPNGNVLFRGTQEEFESGEYPILGPGGTGSGAYVSPPQIDKTTSPLYQLQLEEGINTINKQLAMRGQFMSGPGMEHVADYTRNLAATEAARKLALAQMIAGYGGNAAGTGLQAALGTGQGAMQYGQNMGNVYMQNAANRGNIAMAQGQNQANMWNNIANIGGAGLNAYAGYQGLQNYYGGGSGVYGQPMNVMAGDTGGYMWNR